MITPTQHREIETEGTFFGGKTPEDLNPRILSALRVAVSNVGIIGALYESAAFDIEGKKQLKELKELIELLGGEKEVKHFY